MGKPKKLKAIQNTLKNIRGWHVVFEGEAAGIWTGTKPLNALNLIKDNRLPPHKRVKDLTQALGLWFQRHKAPPVVGAGREIILKPGTEEYEALSSFLYEVRNLFHEDKEEGGKFHYLLRTDGSYSDRQSAMGFAVAIYAYREGAYREVGRVQGGNVGWGSSQVAEYGSIAIGLVLLPTGASVLVESDLEDLVLALQGKAHPNGEVAPYYAVICETVRAKKLKVAARKAKRQEVVIAHNLANEGRQELARSNPLMDFLRMVKAGGRSILFEALRALPSPDADAPGESWEARQLRYLKKKAPELFAEAWRMAKEMTPGRAKNFSEELLLVAMRSKPPTKGQADFLKSLGREIPQDRAEAYLVIKKLKEVKMGKKGLRN